MIINASSVPYFNVVKSRKNKSLHHMKSALMSILPDYSGVSRIKNKSPVSHTVHQISRIKATLGIFSTKGEKSSEFYLLVYVHSFYGLSVCEGDWVKAQKAVNEKIRGLGGDVCDPKSNTGCISRFQISRGWHL